MTARLTARMLVSALLRRVQAEGGNAMVLVRGDESSGAILISCLERGVFQQLLERTLNTGGGYRWQPVGPAASASGVDLADYLERRGRSDPDLWVIELDIPSAERLAAEMIAEG